MDHVFMYSLFITLIFKFITAAPSDIISVKPDHSYLDSVKSLERFLTASLQQNEEKTKALNNVTLIPEKRVANVNVNSQHREFNDYNKKVTPELFLLTIQNAIDKAKSLMMTGELYLNSTYPPQSKVSIRSPDDKDFNEVPHFSTNDAEESNLQPTDEINLSNQNPSNMNQFSLVDDDENIENNFKNSLANIFDSPSLVSPSVELTPPKYSPPNFDTDQSLPKQLNQPISEFEAVKPFVIHSEPVRNPMSMAFFEPDGSVNPVEPSKKSDQDFERKIDRDFNDDYDYDDINNDNGDDDYQYIIYDDLHDYADETNNFEPEKSHLQPQAMTRVFTQPLQFSSNSKPNIPLASMPRRHIVMPDHQASESPLHSSYSFGYKVIGDKASHGHLEKRDGHRVEGTYHVDLPNGYRQIVKYYADETGYHPTITYEKIFDIDPRSIVFNSQSQPNHNHKNNNQNDNDSDSRLQTRQTPLHSPSKPASNEKQIEDSKHKKIKFGQRLSSYAVPPPTQFGQRLPTAESQVVESMVKSAGKGYLPPEEPLIDIRKLMHDERVVRLS